MPTSPLSGVIQHLRAGLGPDGGDRTDAELLARFVRSRDRDALAALVWRHAGMVWGVCRRLLRNQHDAEDAFQAAFLVLARKAADVPKEAVANWLYGVARQTAVRLRATVAKRGRREAQVMNMPEPTTPEVGDADLQGVVDEELSRLPDHYRGVVVLCELEGMTRKEAARQLGIPEGSVASRLARARAMLAKRLTQRGVTLSGGVLAAVLSQNMAAAGVPSSAVSSAIKAASLLAAGQAAGVVSARVAALTEGVVKAMLVNKLKAALSVVLMLGFMATGATLLSYRSATGQDGKKSAAEKPVGPPESKLAAPVPKREKEELTAWGKEIGGLQAGLGYQPGEKRVRGPGETVKLVVRVRNVGKQDVSFQYLRHFFTENPPTVTDDKGKAVALKDGSPRGIYRPVDVTLAPGKEIDLYELSLTLSDKADDTPQASTLYGEGKFQLQYERVLGDSMLSSVSIKTDPALRKLATGKLDLVVSKWIHRAAAGQEGKAITAPENEVDHLQGGWVVTAWEEEGERTTADQLKGKRLVINGNEFAGVGPELTGRMSFALAPEKTPKAIDFTVLEGERKGTTEPGIYAIEGQKLHICYGGKVRPKGFVTTPGSGHTLLTLEREAFTAWGKEVDGLQGGLGYLSGEKRVYRPGETVKLVVRVRNVGKKAVEISYFHQEYPEHPPTVTNQGKPAGPIKGSAVGAGVTTLFKLNLEPGTQADLCELKLAILGHGGDENQRWALHGTGTFRLGYDTLGGAIRQNDGDLPLSKVPTGNLELEVQDRNPAKGAVEKPAPAKTLLKQPEQAKANVTASPKFDPRVLVYRAEPISGKIEDHNPDGKEIVLNVGARDGVRFGHAFQICKAGSTEYVGVAKVMELEGRRCVAKVVSLDQDHAARSLKGLTAICTAPKPERNRTAIESRVGKNVWQTESLENKIIRGLLETSGNESRILIVQDNGEGLTGPAAK